jgi:hypothetical protein
MVDDGPGFGVCGPIDQREGLYARRRRELEKQMEIGATACKARADEKRRGSSDGGMGAERGWYPRERWGWCLPFVWLVVLLL